MTLKISAMQMIGQLMLFRRAEFSELLAEFRQGLVTAFIILHFYFVRLSNFELKSTSAYFREDGVDKQTEIGMFIYSCRDEDAYRGRLDGVLTSVSDCPAPLIVF